MAADGWTTIKETGGWTTIVARVGERMAVVTVPAEDAGMVAAAAGASGWNSVIRAATEGEIAAAERREP